MSNSSMRELGQYLVGPGAIFNSPSPWLLLGLAAVCITLTLAVVFLLRPLAREVRSAHILAAIPVVALASVLLVLISQGCAEWIHDQVRRGSWPKLFQGAGAAFGSLQRIIGGLIFLLGACIVGWGQSRSLSPDTFEQHVFSFTLGTGVVEEGVKAIAGFGFAAFLFNDPPKLSTRQLVFAFTAAGLSFGAGESLFYFQAYAGLGSEPTFYLLRGTWCVLLHGSWSSLTGLLLSLIQFGHQKADNDDATSGLTVLCCCLPAALLHGIYDATCVHSSAGLWTFGLLCLVPFLAGLLLLRGWPDQAEEQTSGPGRSLSGGAGALSVCACGGPQPCGCVPGRSRREPECWLVCPCGGEIGLELCQAATEVVCPRCGQKLVAPSGLSRGGRHVAGGP